MRQGPIHGGYARLPWTCVIGSMIALGLLTDPVLAQPSPGGARVWVSVSASTEARVPASEARHARSAIEDLVRARSDMVLVPARPLPTHPLFALGGRVIELRVLAARPSPPDRWHVTVALWVTCLPQGTRMEGAATALLRGSSTTSVPRAAVEAAARMAWARLGPALAP